MNPSTPERIMEATADVIDRRGGKVPHLAIRLLGSFQVTLAGEPVTDFVTDKARALLAYLAVEAGRPHRRESLAGLLWPEHSESAARASLRRALANLRRIIGDPEADHPLLLVTRQTIQFDRAGDAWVDVTALTELFESAESVSRLEEAVELYRGAFLAGLSVGDSPAFEEWSLLQREQLNRQVLTALHRIADYHEARGNHEQALDYAWRQVKLDSLWEAAHRQVMRLLALSDQRNAALAHYQTMRRTLAEWGIEQEPESDRLYEQIRAGELTPAASRHLVGEVGGHQPRPIGECPYRGLASFQEADADLFYGRDRFVERLVDAVSRQAVVAVIVGSSGSGKSSTVNAGLIPRLRDDPRWLVAPLRPGSRPFHALAAAVLPVLEPEIGETDRLVELGKLADALGKGDVALGDVARRALAKRAGAERLLLVVDQAEELYTLCPEPDLQRRFLDALLGAAEGAGEGGASHLVLLVTLRADFMGQALSYRPLADALQDASLMLGPMSRDELRSAIEQPAERQGAAFEPGLVERLLDDVGEEPGNLPLLEFALTLLWESRTNGLLTHAGYELIGRVEGALARYADHVVEELEAHQRGRARHVFEQLVRPGEGTEDTRRVATRADLGDENWTLVQHLADRRLVVTGRDAVGRETVEVVHEALIQRWGRLQAWMDADRSFRTWQEGLRNALRGWEASDHDDGALLRGAPLAMAESWLAERRSELSEADRNFIRAGAELRERIEADRDRRRRRTIMALAVGVVIASGLAVFALNARSAAQREANVSRSLALAADAQIAFENGETDLALALALEAVDIDEPPSEVQRALSTIGQGPGARAILAGHSNAVRAAALSPDARLALSGSCGALDAGDICTRGELILWDLETGDEVTRFDGHESWVNGVAFSPDGATALSGSDDATLVLWDVGTGEAIRRFEAHTGGVHTVAFSPDGATALSGSDDATLVLWDVGTGEVIRRFEAHAGGVNAVVFSPDGSTALSGSDDATLVLWDVASGEDIHRFSGHTNSVTDVVFHPQRGVILSIGDDLSLREWDAATGVETRKREFGAHPKSLAINPDGRTALVSVKADIRQWDIGAWQEKGQLKGHGGGGDRVGDLNSIAIGAGGRLAISAGSDATVRIWNLAGQTVSRRFATDGTPMEAVAVGSEGSRLLTGLGSGETILWDIDSGEILRRFGGGEGAGVGPDCLAFSPDVPEGEGETSALVCAEDATQATDATSLVLWDLATGREIHRFEGHVTYVRAVAFAPDGASALAGSQSLPDNSVGDLILWDLSTGEAIRRFDMAHDVTNIAMSADGSLALTGSAGVYVAILWDVATGREIRRFEGHTFPVLNVAFGPDEASVLTASIDGSLILWDIDTADVLRRYLGHTGWVWGLDISPDGRFVISSSSDGTVILWDYATGQELRRIAAHTSQVFDVAFHPDGERVFSVAADGELIEWHVADPTLDELVEWIHANRYVRPLTCEERERYRLEPGECG